MSTFRRLSAIDQAEAALEQGIAEGKWGALLPSYQNLGRLLRLSTPTIAKAVNRLVERGLLVSPGKRQRFRIAGKPAKGRRPAAKAELAKPRRHLLVLCPNASEGWDLGQRRVVFETMQSAAEDGWQCSQETVDYVRAKETLKRWDNLLLHHRPTHLFAILGTRMLAKWAKHHGIKVAFVGGHQLKPEEGVSLGIRLSDQLGHCMRVLHAKGHRRILMPYWGELNGFVDFAAKVIGQASGVDPARLVGDGWVFGAPQGTPDAHRERLLRAMQQLRPTAVILTDWRDFVVASQCAAKLGLNVPRDLSLVVLNPGHDSDWALPRPSHYKIQQSFFIDAIRDWRHGKPVSAETMTRAVIESWVEGETVGPAPASGD